MNLTTEEKIIEIERSGLRIAFDGCHKTYLLESEEEVGAALDNGYSIHPSLEIRRLLESSCGLVFVNAWSLSKHPWAIEQFEWPDYDEENEDD